jgi:hypothetical protein
VGGQAHSVAQASSRADFSKSRHRIVMGGLKSMRAQELQCVGGACMRRHERGSETEWKQCDAPANPDCLMARMVPLKP